MLGRIKSALPSALTRFNKVSQRFGATLIPNHFYSEIPDFRELTRETGWRRPMSMHGIAGCELAAQLRTMERWAGGLAARGDTDVYAWACAENGESGFGPIEALALYGFIATERPQRIAQVGCGVSTAIMVRAAQDAGYAPEILCIEPYPTQMLRQMAASGSIRLRSEKAQDVPVGEIVEAAAGGLLFVDSSHTLRPGSEVIQLISEVLPRLPEGQRAHFHDIFFPYDYPPALLEEGIFQFRENTLLYAFLVENRRWGIEVSMSMLHHGAPNELRRMLPGYSPMPMTEGVRAGEGHFPASTYLRAGGGDAR